MQESEPLTSRGEKLSDLRKAARIFGGFEPIEVIEQVQESPAKPEGEKS